MTRLTLCSLIARSRWFQNVSAQAGYLSVATPSVAPARITWSYLLTNPCSFRRKPTSLTRRKSMQESTSASTLPPAANNAGTFVNPRVSPVVMTAAALAVPASSRKRRRPNDRRGEESGRGASMTAYLRLGSVERPRAVVDLRAGGPDLARPVRRSRGPLLVQTAMDAEKSRFLSHVFARSRGVSLTGPRRRSHCRR